MAWYDFLRGKRAAEGPRPQAFVAAAQAGEPPPSSEAAQIIQVFNRHAEESRRRHEELRGLVMTQARKNEELREIVIKQTGKIEELDAQVASLRDRISADSSDQCNINDAVSRRLHLIDRDILRIEKKSPAAPVIERAQVAKP